MDCAYGASVLKYNYWLHQNNLPITYNIVTIPFDGSFLIQPANAGATVNAVLEVWPYLELTSGAQLISNTKQTYNILIEKVSGSHPEITSCDYTYSGSILSISSVFTPGAGATSASISAVLLNNEEQTKFNIDSSHVDVEITWTYGA